MKLTKSKLKRIIKEELNKVLNENSNLIDIYNSIGANIPADKAQEFENYLGNQDSLFGILYNKLKYELEDELEDELGEWDEITSSHQSWLPKLKEKGGWANMAQEEASISSSRDFRLDRTEPDTAVLAWQFIADHWDQIEPLFNKWMVEREKEVEDSVEYNKAQAPEERIPMVGRDAANVAALKRYAAAKELQKKGRTK